MNLVPKFVTERTIASSASVSAVIDSFTPAIAAVLKRVSPDTLSVNSVVNSAPKSVTFSANPKLAVFNVVSVSFIDDSDSILSEVSIPNRRALSAASAAISLTLVDASASNSSVVTNPSVLNSVGIESVTAFISDVLSATSFRIACSLADVSIETASFSSVVNLVSKSVLASALAPSAFDKADRV